MAERAKRILDHTGIKRFSYDHAFREFTLGERTLDIYSAVENPRMLGLFNEDAIAKEEPMLTFAHMNPLSMPGMYRWINEKFTPEVSQQTTEVMMDVYSALSPNVPSDEIRRMVGRGSMGFTADKYPNHGHLNLTVMGLCACLGVDQMSTLTSSQDWVAGYASYRGHNLDWPKQKVSIYAGLAHVAFLAEQDQC